MIKVHPNYVCTIVCDGCDEKLSGFVCHSQPTRADGWRILCESCANDDERRSLWKKCELPSINWDEVKDNWNWLCVSANDRGYLYDPMPEPTPGEHWRAERYSIADALASYSPGLGHWRRRIICRPDPTGQRERQLLRYLSTLEVE